jgi:thiol-disulfide isomerase/thioredoxin
MSDYIIPAPPLATTEWFNSAQLTLEALRGKVVVLGTFQMLCPGCVSTGLPQLQRVFDAFDRHHVSVIGLHTVFEHHTAMTPIALAAFLHEYRISFPVAVDAPSPNNDVPITMARYGFQGTPSLALIDKAGRLRLNRFGHEPDLQLGGAIARLTLEDELPLNDYERATGDTTASCVPGDSCTQGAVKAV